jgi:23S rRNA (cytosine1962-C5)-methyltransferase
MKRIILKPGEERRILLGHPWIYDNEVDRVLEGKSPAKTAALEGGEAADIESSRKEYLGRAFVNPRSKIIARIYSPSKEGADKGFFKRRIREALGRRFMYDLGRDSLRLVFAEADFLPGLIIDRFSGWPLAELEGLEERPLMFDRVREKAGPPRSWLSVQFLCLGMDQRRDMILAALEETLGAGAGDPGLPAGIVEKSGAAVRELEGLPPGEGLLRGTFPPEGILIFENGFPFAVNLLAGQKTGHFLDQRDNRRIAARYGLQSRPGEGPLRVLDGCCYTGGFGIHAARGAAAEGRAVEVKALDASAGALETLLRNARLNGVADAITPLRGDIFELLRGCERRREQFDLVILDPPAFAKSRSVLTEALRGYKEINLQALKLLPPGGILASCSCSQALDEDRFRRMIASAAADAGKRLTLLEFRCQGPDHPVLAGYDESRYLKCGIYRVV